MKISEDNRGRPKSYDDRDRTVSISLQQSRRRDAIDTVRFFHFFLSYNL